MSRTEAARYNWDIENPRGYANAMGLYRTRKERAFLQAHVTGHRLRILDVGGGSGRFAIPLAEQGHAVTVVDISPEAIWQLQRRTSSHISTYCADFLDHTFDTTFDVVVGMESIQYFTSTTLVYLFEKVHRMLRPGGLFVFTELNNRSWRYALHKVRSAIHYNVAAPAGYRRALQAAGFRLIDVKGFVWMPFSVASNSPLVRVFESVECSLGLDRWISQSPWLLIAAQRSRED